MPSTQDKMWTILSILSLQHNFNQISQNPKVPEDIISKISMVLDEVKDSTDMVKIFELTKIIDTVKTNYCYNG